MTKIEVARIPDLHAKLVLIKGVLHQAFVCIFDDDSQINVYEAVAEREVVSDSESEPEIMPAMKIAENTPEVVAEVVTEVVAETAPEAANSGGVSWTR